MYSGTIKRLIPLLIIAFFLFFPSTKAIYPESIHIELNTPYTGYLNGNETISHRVYINQDFSTMYFGYSVNATVIPDPTSNSDIVLEYWSPGHGRREATSDIHNQSKPETINLEASEGKEIFFDVYSANGIPTNYTILVKSQITRVDTGFLNTFLFMILAIIIIVASFIIIRRYYDSIYERITNWMIARANKKALKGAEYQPQPAPKINVDRKAMIWRVIQICWGVALVLSVLFTIFGVNIFEVADYIMSIFG